MRRVTIGMYRWSPLSCLELRRLPVGRGQGAEVVLVGHPGQPGKDVLEVRERILSVAFARDDQRVEDRRALAGVGVTDEEPVLFSNTGRADGIFDEVIVQPTLAVVQ